jgi:hypothetical protein
MYSTDQGSTWSYYVDPVNVGAGQTAHLKSMSSDWSLESRVVVVNEECTDCDNQSVSSSSENAEVLETSTDGEASASSESSQPSAGDNTDADVNGDLLNAWTAGMQEDTDCAVVFSSLIPSVIVTLLMYYLLI